MLSEGERSVGRGGGASRGQTQKSSSLVTVCCAQAMLGSDQRLQVQGVPLGDVLKVLEPCDRSSRLPSPDACVRQRLHDCHPQGGYGGRVHCRSRYAGKPSGSRPGRHQDCFARPVRHEEEEHREAGAGRGGALKRRMKGRRWRTRMKTRTRMQVTGFCSYSWKSAKFLSEISFEDCYRYQILIRNGQVSNLCVAPSRADRDCGNAWGFTVEADGDTWGWPDSPAPEIFLDCHWHRTSQEGSKLSQEGSKLSQEGSKLSQLPGEQLGFSYFLGHLPDSPSRREELQAGDVVFVPSLRRTRVRKGSCADLLAGKKSSASGEVEGVMEESGRVRVRLKDGETIECARGDVEKLLEGLRVLVVPETYQYHQLAHSQVRNWGGAGEELRRSELTPSGRVGRSSARDRV
eukprot:764977-Hanusia_phi.AAC.1